MGDGKSQSMRSISICIRQVIELSKVVSLDRGILRLQEELRPRSAKTMSRHQATIAMTDLFRELASSVTDL